MLDDVVRGRRILCKMLYLPVSTTCSGLSSGDHNSIDHLEVAQTSPIRQSISIGHDQLQFAQYSHVRHTPRRPGTFSYYLSVFWHDQLEVTPLREVGSYHDLTGERKEK